MKFFCKAIFFFIFLYSSIPVCANDSLPIFHLSIQDGLSNNSVRCIYQDKKGFIWFGTYDGLNRYDGSEFKIFRNRLSDSTSIPHNYIYTIHEDVFNYLWVGTGQGVAIYNNNSAKFSPVYYHDIQSAQIQKMNFNTNAINSDENGNVFIGSNGWGFLLKKVGEKTARQIPLKVGTETYTGYNVKTISVFNKKIWLFILDWGLCQFDLNTEKMIPLNDMVKNANCMLPDKDGNMWIGTDKGLYKYNCSLNKYSEFYPEMPGKLNSSQVTSLCFDHRDNLWIGTDGGGINILNKLSHSFSYIIPDESKYKLSSEAVYSIISDKESRIWIGTIKGGCNIIDEQKTKFSTVTSNPLTRNTLPSNFIYSFCEDRYKNLLIGTDGGGLSIWDRKTNIFHNYKHNNNIPNSLSHNAVTSIRQDYKGDIWVATFGGGINKFNRHDNNFEHYYCINDSTGIENTDIWLLYEDRDKTLWATTFSNGKLYRLNRITNRFEVFSQQLNNLVSITEDSQGNLWAGNASQLTKIDKLNRHHILYEIGKPVRAIYEDRKHNLWLGGEGGGLILFDTKSGKITQRFSDADGLCNNAVLNIKEDSQGYLWLSTFNGLSKFDPAKKIFKNFYQSDGLQSNQFSYNAALQLNSGEMVFGGINGFNIFTPENILTRKYMPSVFITDILINNKPIAEASEFIAKEDNTRITELKIPYDQAVLSFRFNALEYSSPEKIIYAYYLQGWDKGWNYTGNVRNINYNNLHEGSYTLRVKNTNANGEWNSNESNLKIIILPPWYRSWWAYLLYFILVVSLIYIYMRYRAQQVQLKYKVKLIQLNAEKEKEINESRQSFFTNITHEFRTPLTLIINPIKDILRQENAPEGKSELNFVYRNARRLLSLVDQLLLFRTTESDTGSLRIVKLNFYDLCHDIFLYFIQQAKTKNIDYIFDCSNGELEIFGDKEKLGIIFYNLLSNAFKYTPENGKIIFRITERAETIHAEIIDNGTGIPSHIGAKLFEKYYRVNEKDTPVKPGFGIGLYLVKQFIDKHKGQITYTSNPGQGTCFSVTLTKKSIHFGDIQLQNKLPEELGLLDEIAAGNESAEEVQDTKTDGLEAIVSERQTILITDDNAQMRSYLVQVFQQSFIVHEASNGEEGFKIAKDVQPDIIISDVVMDNMSGIDLCKAVKDSPVLNHIPFILITGSFSSESELKGIEYGADDYITKPFDKDLLVAKVQSLIRRQQNLQKYFYNEITLKNHDVKISEEYKEFLEKCISIVESHLNEDDFDVKKFTGEIGMSHSNLFRKIKNVSGQSISGFIRYIRLRKAAELMIKDNVNVNEAAFQVNIKDIKYFRKQFNELFGLNPSEYIKKYRTSFNQSYTVNDKGKSEK